MGDLEARIQAIRDEIDTEVALALREPHRAMVLDIYRAAQALAAAVDREAAYHRSVISLGYGWVEGLAPRWPLGAGTLLGSERDQNSQLSQYRENLERLGILK